MNNVVMKLIWNTEHITDKISVWNSCLFAIVESILEHFLNVCFEEGWGGWRTIVGVDFLSL